MKTHNSPPRIILAALCAFLCVVATRAQVSQNIGTLEPGQSVTINYEVTINDPLSPAITQISSQPVVTQTSIPVAQTSSLLCRRFPIGSPHPGPGLSGNNPATFSIRTHAGWKPATQQTGSLRYGDAALREIHLFVERSFS